VPAVQFVRVPGQPALVPTNARRLPPGVNRHNGQARHVYGHGDGGATAAANWVHLWDFAGSTSQLRGQYRCGARHSGKCLAVDGPSAADGSRMTQQACPGASAQALTLTR
jgi:glucosylceramidase